VNEKRNIYISTQITLVKILWTSHQKKGIKKSKTKNNEEKKNAGKLDFEESLFDDKRYQYKLN